MKSNLENLLNSLGYPAQATASPVTEAPLTNLLSEASTPIVPVEHTVEYNMLFNNNQPFEAIDKQNISSLSSLTWREQALPPLPNHISISSGSWLPSQRSEERITDTESVKQRDNFNRDFRTQSPAPVTAVHNIQSTSKLVFFYCSFLSYKNWKNIKNKK